MLHFGFGLGGRILLFRGCALLERERAGSDLRLAALAKSVFQVLHSPFLNVDRKHFGIDEAATKRLFAMPVADLVLQPAKQVTPDGTWHVVRMHGIAIAKQQQAPEQDLPMITN